MTHTDAFAITTAQAAIRTALAALAVAYKASTDCRLESLIADTLNAIEEAAADLNVIEGQIEDDSADERAAAQYVWFPRYAAV